MPVPVTDETRAYMCRAFLQRAADESYARHMESEARRYGATDEQIANAWNLRATFLAPTVIRSAA